MDGTVHIYDDTVLCGSCVHCGDEDDKCHSGPNSKVRDCPDYERKLSDILDTLLTNQLSVCVDCIMRNNCALMRDAKGDRVVNCAYYTPEWRENFNQEKTDDNVNHPSHYTQGGIECLDAIEAAMKPDQFRGYLKGNIIKYLWRYEWKNGLEDLKKAQFYMNRMVKSMEKEKENENV